MVFGYYHINLRSLDPKAIPELGPVPGKISEKLKVGHMLWIPFFPMGKKWVLEANGEMYELNPKAKMALQEKLGPSKTPWYAFTGLIAIPVLIVGFMLFNFVEDRARKKNYEARIKQESGVLMAKINDPQKDDVFFFESRGKTVPAKVNYSTADSIFFLAPLDNERDKKFWQEKWAMAYFNSDNPTQEVAFAREDLKKTFKQEITTKVEGLPAGKLPLKGKFKLKKVVTNDPDAPAPIVDAALSAHVKKEFEHFLEHRGNQDSLMALMDSKSKEYFQNLQETARKSDADVIKYIKSNRKMPNIVYELMLNTKHVYQFGMEKSAEGKSAEEKLSSYVFFLRLLERGFLSLGNENMKNIKVKGVDLPAKDLAIINVSARSNILQRPKDVVFRVALRKEDGRWKVNIPSSFSFTERQISGDFVIESGGKKQWRDLVLTRFAELGQDIALDDAWFY